MLDEDVVIKTTRNTNESILILNVVLAVLAPAIFFGGTSELFIGMFVSLGIVAPINTVNYILTWQQNPKKEILKMLMCCVPFIALMVISTMGQINGGIENIELGGFVYYALGKIKGCEPISVCANMLEPILDNLATFMAYLCGLSIFFITDSRFVVRKILIWISLLVSLLAIFGSLIMFMWNFEGSIFSESTSNFFSTFQDSAQWASFGILWLGASLAVANFSIQRFRSFSFFYSLKFLGLVTSLVLYISVLLSGKSIHYLCASIILGVASMMMAFDVMPIKMNARKHEMLRHISSHALRLKKMRFPFMCYTLLAIFAWFIAINTGIKICNDTKLLLVDSSNPNSITYVEKASVMEDARKIMTEDRIPFGYGASSFKWIFSLSQGSDLGSSPWKSPNSDLLHEFIENGVIGLVLFALPFVFFVLRWLIKASFSSSGVIMMMSLFSILLISVVEIPFQNLAVLTSFWVIAMSAFRWDDAKVG